VLLNLLRPLLSLLRACLVMTKPQAFIGIDPGAKGAVCLLVPVLDLVDFIDNSASNQDIYSFLLQSRDGYNLRAIMIEKVHSLMGMSAKSNFSFGYNVGEINTLASLSGIMVDHVTPKQWQSKIGIAPKSKTIKKDVAEICDKLYPGSQTLIRGPRGGLMDGRSDALMIAHFNYLKHKV